MSSRRDAVLREMGLAPLWKLRSRASGHPDAIEEPPADAPAAPDAASRVRHDVARRAPLKVAPPAAAIAAAPREHEQGERGASVAGLDWDALIQEIRQCTACPLCRQRKQAVPGVGDRQADWLFVGEGPGAEEDERGEPFVGQAGRLLDAMLAAIGLRRGENVYIANAVKCRPPHNRTPEAEEMAACFPYLARQIELIRPKLIVALGRPAAQALLNADVKIGAARGRPFAYRDIPVVVTYHPAYLLRNQADKAKAWEDLCFARRSFQSL
ncbi:MAG: uracil-DNA glycosylase [Zoogloea sp.]|nr:uracil-DNA glycosylase [Zoogloea sp.]